MKKLLIFIYLIFNFQSLIQADDITDFQIEEITVGDSLLKHLSISKIKQAEKNHTKMGKDFIMIFYYQGSSSNLYNDVQITYNPNDDKYIVHQISGFLDYKNNIKDCLKKKDQIKKEINQIFKKVEIKNKSNLAHPYDKSGKTKYWSTDFILEDGAVINVGCMDWSKKFEEENNWQDSLDVSINSSVYMKYLETLYN